MCADPRGTALASSAESSARFRGSDWPVGLLRWDGRTAALSDQPVTPFRVAAMARAAGGGWAPADLSLRRAGAGLVGAADSPQTLDSALAAEPCQDSFRRRPRRNLVDLTRKTRAQMAKRAGVPDYHTVGPPRRARLRYTGLAGCRNQPRHHPPWPAAAAAAPFPD